MTCSRCRKKFEQEAPRCPHCGQPSSGDSGTFQTSTVLISAAGADRIYRSVEDVPKRLRTRLLKSTNGANSATILIADRRGRKEISRAMRKLPGPAQRRLMQSILGADSVSATIAWLTPRRRLAIMTAIALCCLALIAFVFTHRW
jgi:predicted amidophosphoribosyltransferase